ncbi:uncharacterized protein DFL_002982 [Arthrobotrys flagrans]|uniref:F-box domain-containing protein n=1 Tax=Arthrobotrys flagrans TaxID=97331 RepID=A0A437AC21_ARTFL|nr:hypothetical protein DFL_002982 [Arthrobotrys flagrans]
MTSLDSLPQELVDMILSDLTLFDLTKIRLLSASHNSRFKYLYWSKVFTEIRLTLRTAHLQRLLNLLKGSRDELKQYLRYIIICPIDSYNEVKDPKVKLFLKSIMKELSYLETVEFDIPERSLNAIDHWKPVIDAIIASNHRSITTLKSPRCGLAMSSFNVQDSKLASYSTTFQNLKSLEVSTSVQFERAEVTFAFWNWINVIGSNLEELGVAGYRSQGITRPKPDAEGRYLPKDFDLPKLKSLELVDVCLTLRDLKTVVRNTAVIEEVRIVGCVAEMNRPSYFFKFLKYLKDEKATRLQSLELILSGYHDDIVSYELPNISFTGNWADPKTLTMVELNPRKDAYINALAYTSQKHLWTELSTHNNTVDFWSSLTDGKWVDRDVTIWKKQMWAGGRKGRPGRDANCEWARLFKVHAVYYDYPDPRWVPLQDQTRVNIEVVNEVFERGGVVWGEGDEKDEE